MKKVLTFVALAAMVCFVSCQKANTGKKGDKDSGKTEYVQPITIDGQFDDWAKLDASKVAVAKCTEGATDTALKIVKVYADALFVFVYFEWDTEQTEWVPGEDHVPFHMYINGDGDAKTGGYTDQFSDGCSDLLLHTSWHPLACCCSCRSLRDLHSRPRQGSLGSHFSSTLRSCSVSLGNRLTRNNHLSFFYHYGLLL